ncbi:hypothetical protein SSPH_04675 [Sporomusa sphaeroides DSM 2875]|uniref:Uncharacterized protein n=1 Tax=Sporomusa sphaeroides DSM 2875 TaxID=1337886 RepID=A0ABM9W9X0_9FIRM|nr:hypothetical protein SSPH_04675 [Sporomusa sphaeroides DSM 2875]
MVSCVCVGLEAHIRHEHSRNCSRIDTVSLRLSQGEAFPVKIGVQGVNDIGVQTIVKEKPENVVAVVSGSLKPYLYFVQGQRTGTDFFQQVAKSFHAVLDGEHICKDFTLRTDDEAVVFILSDINPDTNHSKTSNGII